VQFLRRPVKMMSSASTPDFRATLRRQQQRRPNTLTTSSSMYGLSTQAKSTQSTQPATTVADQPDTRSVDPTFEPLERAGRAINEGIRKDDRFPELDQLVQRMHLARWGLTCVEGASNNYGLPEDSSWFPFQRTQILTIPDAIFAQYNSTCP
jgi:hypothetical protein